MNETASGLQQLLWENTLVRLLHWEVFIQTGFYTQVPSTPLLLPPFFPKYYTGSANRYWRHCLQHYRRLQVLVTGRKRYWSTSTHLVCVPLVVQARTCYSSCFWSTALSLSLLLSGFHLACTSTSLGAISLPCLLPCSGLLSRQGLIHSTWRYFAGGGTNLVYGQ